MTLIIGIVCKDGIVIAGDSQTTWQTGKSWEANKLEKLECANGFALAAESGATITSSSILEELKNQAISEEKTEKHSLPELAQMAVRKTRDKLRFQNFECSSEELEHFIDRNDLQSVLMFAHYEGDTPRIDTISLKMGISQRAKTKFEVVGSGSDLAHYLLSNLLHAKQKLDLMHAIKTQRPASEFQIDIEEAVQIAVYVIEVVKRHDPYCGGPTKLGIIRHPNRIEDGEHLVITDLSGNVLQDESLPVFIPCQLEIDKIVKSVSITETAANFEFWVGISEELLQQRKKQIKEYQDIAKEIEEKYGQKNTKSRK